MKNSAFIYEAFYKKFLRFSHMLKKKEVTIYNLYSKKPRKNLHPTQEFHENFWLLVKKTKTVLQIC